MLEMPGLTNNRTSSFAAAALAPPHHLPVSASALQGRNMRGSEQSALISLDRRRLAVRRWLLRAVPLTDIAEKAISLTAHDLPFVGGPALHALPRSLA